MIISLSQFASANAQIGQPFCLETKVHYGFLGAHREAIQYLANDHLAPLELSFVKRGSSKAWHSLYGKPLWGFSLFYADFKNPDEMGWGTGIVPHVSLHFLRKDKLEFNMKMGAGLGYVSKVFDPFDNYKNLAVSTRLNLLIILQPELRFQVTDRLGLVAGLGGIHYSNAAFRVPNLGYNFLTASLGVNYQIGEAPVADEFIAEKRSEDIEFLAALAFGAKENYPINGPSYLASSMMLEAIKPLGQKSKISGGADFFYDRGISQYVQGSDSTSFGNILQTGLKAGYELHINAVSVLFQMGAYIQGRELVNGRIYHRIGGRIQLLPHVHLNLTLKSHYARADYFETGISYNLGR